MNLKQILKTIRIREAQASIGPKGNRPSLQKVFNRVKRAALKQVHDPGHPDKKKISKAEAAEQLKHDIPGAKGTS